MDKFLKFVHYYLAGSDKKFEDCLVSPYDFWNQLPGKTYNLYEPESELIYKFKKRNNYHVVGIEQYMLDEEFNFFEFKHDIYAPLLDLSEYPLIIGKTLTPYGLYCVFQETDYGNLLIADYITGRI